MHLHLRYGSTLLLLTIAFSAISYGQEEKLKSEQIRKQILNDPKVSSVQVSGERQTASMIVYDTRSEHYTKTRAASLLWGYLGVRGGVDDLRLSKQTSVKNNMEVIEFQQYFKGIKVEHGRYKALARDGGILLFNGAWYDVPANLSIQPRLAKQNALEKAVSKIGARKYAIDFFKDQIDKTSDPNLKKALAKEMEEVLPKGELVVIKDFNIDETASMRLAYKFNIYATEPMSRHWVYVDATDGKILAIDAIIKHANPDPPSSVTTTVQTRYAGARNIRVKQVSGNDPHSGLPLVSSHPGNEIYIPGSATWVLVDDTRGKGVETYDLNGVGGVPFSLGAFYAQGKSFTDVDNNWTLFEHKRSDPLGNGLGQDGPFEAENDDIAWDAHWGAEVVYDYWLLKHNRKSFDGRDAKIKSFIHFGPAYDNAFWNGSAMTYGDGSGTAADGFKALTSLDVCAHEIGHGVNEYTSGLVYQRESGAMNEAFSDIWAAAVERFAITSIDATLVNKYRPFYIGEQIGASVDLPLRRMDNPKQMSDPDTYGGQFWKDPNCDPPDLVLNDYCGVHTNSGLLNKWFYLMTVGSHNGSGPDAMYARADSDDGVNDLGNNYNVTGLGFNVSEQVAFLTETLLTSTATYAEAREVSISVAIALSGDACSNIVSSVTNAWYAIGVGAQFSGASCISTFGFIYQPGATVSEGIAPGGCTGESSIKVPVLLPANSTATINTSGTASVTSDYRLSSTTFSNTTAVNKVVDLLVYIKNDAIVESDETINLGITITNTGGSPVNQTYTISITEDDIIPVIGSGTVALLNNGGFNGQPDGYGAPAGWTTITDVPGNNRWGVWGGQLRITGEVQGIQLPPGHYDNLSASTTMAIAPQVDARGLNNISLKFDFRVQGEMDASSANPDTWGVFDYMTVVYSFDGVDYHDLRVLSENFRAFCSLTPTQGTFEAVLPSLFNNKVFYIGFKWFNDTNAGGPESVSIDNVSLMGGPKLIENDLNHNSRENLRPGNEVYFYTVQDGQLVGKVKNNSLKDFGCSNLFVERAGNGTFNLFQNGQGLHKVGDKIVRIETGFIYKASTTVTVYFTEQQLAALESMTNQPRSSFRVYHVTAAGYTQATARNTDIYTPVYSEIPGAGGSFTIAINAKANGSYALGSVVSVLGPQPANWISEADISSFKLGSIYPNLGNGEAFVSIQADKPIKLKVEYVSMLGELISSQVEQVQPGSSRIVLKLNALAYGTYIVRFRNEKQELLGAQLYIRH